MIIIGAGDYKVLMNPVNGKDFAYYGLKSSINDFYNQHA